MRLVKGVLNSLNYCIYMLSPSKQFLSQAAYCPIRAFQVPKHFLKSFSEIDLSHGYIKLTENEII